jgi:hypothetical protein
LVSAALLGGVPRKAFDKLLDNGVVLVSVPVLLELADVLNRPKFDKYLTHDERMRFMVSFLKVAEMVEISQSRFVETRKTTNCRSRQSAGRLIFW